MSHEELPVAPASRPRLYALVVIGFVCLLIGLAACYIFYLDVGQQLDDVAPLPSLKRNAPFVLSPDSIVETMVELARLTKDDLLYDLGCGDGRIAITAALLSGCHSIGFDIDAERVNEARENATLNGVENLVSFQQQDVFRVDLSQADVAMMYLLPWMMDDLLPQFEKMKPGSRIISHEFWMAGVEPDKYIQIPSEDGEQSSGIFVYTTPLHKNPAVTQGQPPAISPVDSR